MSRCIRRLVTVALWAIWYLTGGACCAPLQVGPFPPAHPRACAADPDCREGEHCGFVAVDTRAVCLPGPGDVP